MLRYVLSILSVIILIGIVTVVTFKFDPSFAFHTPGSGFTIIGGQVYANNGTDSSSLAPLFVRPQNDTSLFPNQPPTAAPQQFPNQPPTAAPQQFPNQPPTAAPQQFPNQPPTAAPQQFPNQPPTAAPQQSINGTQNSTASSPSNDILSHLSLARQAVELGDPDTILKSLDYIQQQLLGTNNITSADFSTLSNYSNTGLNQGNTGNTTNSQPEDMEDFVPVEEQRPTSSASHRDPAQRIRAIQ